MFQIYNPFCMCKIDGFAEGSDRFSDISTGGQGVECVCVDFATLSHP